MSLSAASVATLANDGHADEHGAVANEVIAAQRDALAKNTAGKGFGPQSPRDINAVAGTNPVRFSEAPQYSKMNLCNIHFHKNAEHAGGEFTRYAGNGDGKGGQSGYVYTGRLSKEEATKLPQDVCSSEHGGLNAGDTIELHYVHSSAQVSPGATLGACMNDAIKNPQLRVEAQVLVLVNDAKAQDFGKLAQVEQRNGYHQAINLPNHTGKPVRYAGSTTGPAYNEAGSPFQVSWSVRPKVIKVNAESVGNWCKANAFKEDHAHGVRNLVTQPELLSPIKR
ncbi:hypothetical protein KSF73_14340 [Burkholderiaceae bacterium DAT-1]|nr:hypothetical protein [Burkholderiaceae bacterium DAT-1]